MISSMVSKRIKEINPERYITSELKKKASADKTDTMKTSTAEREILRDVKKDSATSHSTSVPRWRQRRRAQMRRPRCCTERWRRMLWLSRALLLENCAMSGVVTWRGV